MRQSPLTSFKELRLNENWLDFLIVLLILPASYSTVNVTIEGKRAGGIKQFVEEVHQLYDLIIKSAS